MDPEFVPVEVKREPSEEFLLILPSAMEDEPEPEPVEVKREPSVDFVLILPPATEAEPEPEQASSSRGFKCDQCSYQANTKGNTKGNLAAHKGIHNKSKSCETCQKKFATNPALKHHQMQHKHGIYETSEETFNCHRCDKSFRTRDNLGIYQRYAHDEEEAKCEVCGKICRNRKSLLNHSKTHVKVECLICHKMINKSSIAAHKRVHSTQKTFECDLCEHSAKTKEHLKEHIERKHLLRQLVSDSKCRSDFSDFELLEELQHKYGIVIKSSEKKFKCDKCATTKTLNLHKKGVHAEKSFECEKCKKAFKSRSNLNQHNANVHSSKVSCSICSKKVGQSYLKAHMKVHLPSQHFECDFCGYKTARKQDFARHINAKHRNEALKLTFGRRVKIVTTQRNKLRQVNAAIIMETSQDSFGSQLIEQILTALVCG